MTEYPLLQLGVIIGSQSFVGEALPDTGYDGTVIVPANVGREVERKAALKMLQLADGRVVHARTWAGRLLLETRTFRVTVHALGDQYIIGRKVLDQMEICFEFGERVRLRLDRDSA
jgi:hypothetical protein